MLLLRSRSCAAAKWLSCWWISSLRRRENVYPRLIASCMKSSSKLTPIPQISDGSTRTTLDMTNVVTIKNTLSFFFNKLVLCCSQTCHSKEYIFWMNKWKWMSSWNNLSVLLNCQSNVNECTGNTQLSEWFKSFVCMDTFNHSRQAIHLSMCSKKYKADLCC